MLVILGFILGLMGEPQVIFGYSEKHMLKRWLVFLAIDCILRISFACFRSNTYYIRTILKQKTRFRQAMCHFPNSFVFEWPKCPEFFLESSKIQLNWDGTMGTSDQLYIVVSIRPPSEV